MRARVERGGAESDCACLELGWKPALTLSVANMEGWRKGREPVGAPSSACRASVPATGKQDMMGPTSFTLAFSLLVNACVQLACSIIQMSVLLSQSNMCLPEPLARGV